MVSRGKAIASLVIVFGLIAAWVASGVLWQRPLTSGLHSASPSGIFDESPYTIRPEFAPIFASNSDIGQKTQKMLAEPLRGTCSPPLCFHMVRLHGWGAMPGMHFARGDEIKKALTDAAESRRRFGESLFFATRYGVRYRPAAAAREIGAENHRDVCLATLAEGGLPLDTPITTPERTYALRDVLNDSVANFHLDQEELTWTAIAYSIYPTIKDKWTNRYEESFTWEEVVGRLTEQKLAASSCSGTHILYAMIILRRATDLGRQLPAGTFERLNKWLADAVNIATKNQHPDGSWGTDWWAGLSPDRQKVGAWDNRNQSLEWRVLVTGHLLECLTYLPYELRPRLECYEKAGAWLAKALADPAANESVTVCPRTHSLCALRTLCGLPGQK